MGDEREILLVEDDPDVAEILTIVLTGAEFAVVRAATLRDARIALTERVGRLDAIVTDKNLPDGSGIALLEEARALGSDAEMVVITGFPSLDSAIQALRLGVYDYLEKPFRNLEDVVATIRRACDHRRIRHERDEARARAVHAERRATLVQVAAGLAHEVKNPLQGIGFASFNARSALEEMGNRTPVITDVLEQITVIELESRRLRDLVEGVMDLARPTPRPKQRMSVEQLVQNVVMLHGRRAEQATVRIEVEVPKDLALMVDEGDLSRALDNLVRNALDVAPAGSAVRIAAMADDKGAVSLSVSDEGPGFPPDAWSQMFTPFFTTKPRGFGLGLCQVAAAADRAGGTVNIQDNIPRGARVTLRIPVTKEGALA